MATYLDKVQWRVRPDAIVSSRPPVWQKLDVKLGKIESLEVKRAVDKMKKNKASGVDEIPAEFLKALVSTDDGLTVLVDLCELCWSSKEVPNEWQLSRVRLLFKKGDPADCGNYRPISLLCVGYKLLAAILLDRLKDAGAESRLWKTQCGFKSKVGTADALYIARRILDQIWDSASLSTIFLALDWAKAFDSISPAGLSNALLRFGIPDEFVNMVNNIYKNRRFLVSECNYLSSYY